MKHIKPATIRRADIYGDFLNGVYQSFLDAVAGKKSRFQ